MPALASPSTWRTDPYSATFHVVAVKPVVVFQALLPASLGVTYPMATIPYDTGQVLIGAYTDIKDGMLVRLGTIGGSDDLGRGFVRGGASSGTINVNWYSQGTRDGEFNLTASCVVEVLNLRPVFAKTPRFLDNGTGYKFYDLDFATYGQYPPPKANGGPGYAEYIDPDTEVITVPFADQGSYVNSDGATITGYAWDFIDGTPASSSASSPGNVTFPAGFRYVKYTVTDSNAKSHTQYIPVYAANETTFRPIQCQIIGHSRQADGTEIQIRLLETLSYADYPDGTLFMIFARERYGSTAGSLAGPTGRQHMQFIGWLEEERSTVQFGRSGREIGTTLKLVDIAGRLRQLPAFPQEIRRKITATTWQQMEIGKCSATIARFVDYILRWHSSALELTDFFPLGTDYPFSWLESDGRSLWEQASTRCKAIAHQLGCDWLGRLKMKIDPQLQLAADRTSTVIVDLLAGDHSSISTTYSRPPRVHWERGAALLISTGDADSEIPVPYESLAPGHAPGQGLNSNLTNYQLVKTQTEFLVREGRLYVARQNARSGHYSIKLTHGGEAGIDPSDMEWVRATQPVADYRSRSFTLRRFLPVEVRFTYNHRNRTRSAEVIVEEEVLGDINAIDIPIIPKQSNIFGDYSGGPWVMPQIESILDLGLNPNTLDYGDDVDYDPASQMQLDQTPGAASEYGRAWVCTDDCMAVRMTWPAGTIDFDDISPSATQRDTVGTAIGATFDPFNLKSIYILGELGGAWTPDATITTPVWKIFSKNANTVTFDADSLMYYLVNGNVVANGSYITPTDGQFLRNGTTSPTTVEFITHLSQTLRVTKWEVTVQRKHQNGYTGFDNATMTATFYDATGAQITQSTVLIQATGGQWGYYSKTVDISGVRSIRLHWQQAGWFHNALEIAVDNFKITTTTDTGGTPFAGFQGVQNHKGMFVWLSKKAVSGTDYVYFNSTLDYFNTTNSVQVAKWQSGMTYGITVQANNWRKIWVTAGLTSNSTALVYSSINGGVSFTPTARALNAKGGALWMNRSTETPNVQNTLESNVLVYEGADGSNNQKVARGLTAAAVTVVTHADRYPGSEKALYALPKDLSFVRVIMRTGHYYYSNDGGATWNAAAGVVTGGASFIVKGLSGWPTDSTFNWAFGELVLSFTLNTGTNWTDVWTASYDAWRNTNLGANAGKKLVAVLTDLSSRYKVTVNT